MSLSTIRTQLVAVESAIAGINKVYLRVPNEIDVPAPVMLNVYRGASKASGGRSHPSFGMQRYIARRFDISVLVALQTDVARAEEQLEPFEKLVLDALDLNKTLNGVALSSEAGDWTYGEVQLRAEDPASKYLGLTFHYEVTELEKGSIYG